MIIKPAETKSTRSGYRQALLELGKETIVVTVSQL
jgi:hypothetical protein